MWILLRKDGAAGLLRVATQILRFPSTILPPQLLIDERRETDGFLGRPFLHRSGLDTVHNAVPTLQGPKLAHVLVPNWGNAEC